MLKPWEKLPCVKWLRQASSHISDGPSCQELEMLRACLKVQCERIPVASVSEHLTTLKNVTVSRHSCDFCVSQNDVHKNVMKHFWEPAFNFLGRRQPVWTGLRGCFLMLAPTLSHRCWCPPYLVSSPSSKMPSVRLRRLNVQAYRYCASPYQPANHFLSAKFMGFLLVSRNFASEKSHHCNTVTQHGNLQPNVICRVLVHSPWNW